MKNAVEFKHVWKKFSKGEKFNSLRDAVPNIIKSFSSPDVDKLNEREFWAVRDVDFSIPPGGVVGVMGPNGAGKSTILKLLSGIMAPTKGEMVINGRLSALIEVTAGFHPELTGRENVFLNGTILGMKRKEIEGKFDEIVEFSGVGEFIDTPVKRYSSGMYSRLGFSVAAHMNPEILIVDEVLSVGDISFQAKCAQKMRELLNSGATIILVSHQIPLVQSLCKRVVLLNHGQVVKDGLVDEVIPAYQEITFKRSEDDFKKRVKTAEERIKPDYKNLVEITKAQYLGDELQPRSEFDPSTEMTVRFTYKTKEKIIYPIMIIDILRSDGVLCCQLNSKDMGLEITELAPEGNVELKFSNLNLCPGVYLVKISVWDREMIHPYVVYSNDVVRISSNQSKSVSNAVFQPQAVWKMYGP